MNDPNAWPIVAAWARYADAFGEPPHGTAPQLGALAVFLRRAIPEPGGRVP